MKLNSKRRILLMNSSCLIKQHVKRCIIKEWTEIKMLSLWTDTLTFYHVRGLTGAFNNTVEDTRVILQSSESTDSYINANFVHVRIKIAIIKIESSRIRQKDNCCLRSKRQYRWTFLENDYWTKCNFNSFSLQTFRRWPIKMSQILARGLLNYRSCF